MNLLQINVQRLQEVIEIKNQVEYASALKTFDIPQQYATNMGRLLLSAELDALKFADSNSINYDFGTVCKRKEDMRCQAGHVLSHLRSKKSLNHSSFSNNVRATVLIVDKKGLNLPSSPPPGKFFIDSLECRQGLSLTNYGAPPGVLLCDDAFYANERIPNTRIFGSGHFFDHDKIVTAAHILEKALKEKMLPSDMLFIRAHYVYDSLNTIGIFPKRLFVLDQALIKNDQIINGTGGDIAWLKVKPLWGQPGTNNKRVYKGKLNGLSPNPLTRGTPVYALGHGLGLPMKLSFGGVVTKISPAPSAEFNCDMNILPGSSGSPIFHAETHKLVGVVSGLHEIHTDFVEEENCSSLKIDMSGDLSGVATHVFPLLSPFKK